MGECVFDGCGLIGRGFGGDMTNEQYKLDKKAEQELIGTLIPLMDLRTKYLFDYIRKEFRHSQVVDRVRKSAMKKAIKKSVHDYFGEPLGKPWFWIDNENSCSYSGSYSATFYISLGDNTYIKMFVWE